MKKLLGGGSSGKKKEVGAPRRRVAKPDWVVAMEEGKLEDLRTAIQAGPLSNFEGPLGHLEVNGNWTPLGAACFFDNADAVRLLLGQGNQNPNTSFHRLGTSYSPLAYSKEFDKNKAHEALSGEKGDLFLNRDDSE